MQVQIVNVIRNICLENLGLFTFIIVIFTKIFVFCSGFISVAFITIITKMCYEVGCCITVEKSEIFIFSSLGYVIYFVFFILISIYLNKINQQYLLGSISMYNIQESKEYLFIQLLTKIFKFLHSIYMIVILSISTEDNTWSSSLKYGILLAVVYVVQNFMMTKG